MEVLGLLAFSTAAGGFGAVIGAGGGFVIVPVLVLAFGWTPQEAVGTTALAVLLISLAATASYLPARRIDIRAAALVALPGIPAAAAGARLLEAMASGRWFTVGLGAFFLLLAILIVLQSRARPRTTSSPTFLAAGGVMVGVVTGTFAAGGGLLTVPLLMRWGALRIQRATATTALAIVPASAAAVAFQVALGNVPWIGLGVALAAAGGARAGAAWSERWAPVHLVLVTASAVATMGLLTLVDGLDS